MVSWGEIKDTPSVFNPVSLRACVCVCVCDLFETWRKKYGGYDFFYKGDLPGKCDFSGIFFFAQKALLIGVPPAQLLGF